MISTLAFGAISAVGGALLGAFSKVVQEVIIERRRERKLTTVLCGELLNIKRHYSIVQLELDQITQDARLGEKEISGAVNWEKRKYGTMGLIGKDLYSFGFVLRYSIDDFLQLSLYVRNNDLEISNVIEMIKAGSYVKECPTASLARFNVQVAHLRERMVLAIKLCDRLLRIYEDRLDYANNKRLIGCIGERFFDQNAF
jgi:hypothetical protein